MHAFEAFLPGAAAEFFGLGFVHSCQCPGHFASFASNNVSARSDVGPAQFGGPQVGSLLGPS